MNINKKYIFPTIDIESWVCSAFFKTERTNIDESETILEPLNYILKTFDKFNIQTTFFVLAESANKVPEIVENIVEKGHEIASHSLTHTSITEHSIDELIYEVKNSKKILENISKEKISGFRAPNAKVNENLLIIKKLGFNYDSSIVSSMKISGWYGGLSSNKSPYYLSKEIFGGTNSDSILEFPISSHPIIKLPFGGWWMRNLGYHYTINALKLSLKKYQYANFYLHPWEFVNNNNNKYHVDAPFHVFRRTGDYTQKSLAKIIKGTISLGNFCRLDEYKEMHF